MKFSISLGKVYRSKEGAAGYFMVMKLTKNLVTYSPLFWREEIIYHTCHPKFFKNWYPELHTGDSLSAKIKARYDHELMRRLKIICRESHATKCL